jgi:hypothetical protein
VPAWIVFHPLKYVEPRGRLVGLAGTPRGLRASVVGTSEIWIKRDGLLKVRQRGLNLAKLHHRLPEVVGSVRITGVSHRNRAKILSGLFNFARIESKNAQRISRTKIFRIRSEYAFEATQRHLLIALRLIIQFGNGKVNLHSSPVRMRCGQWLQESDSGCVVKGPHRRDSAIVFGNDDQVACRIKPRLALRIATELRQQQQSKNQLDPIHRLSSFDVEMRARKASIVIGPFIGGKPGWEA